MSIASQYQKLRIDNWIIFYNLIILPTLDKMTTVKNSKKLYALWVYI